MYIQEVKIKNFRGLNIDIQNLKKDFLIIGKNDSGKSNFCYALRKVLDYNIRRIPLLESDSSNYNKEIITIFLKINLSGISRINKNSLGTLVEKTDDGDFVNIYFEAIFSNETMNYDETLKIGSLDSKNYATNNSNPLDKVLDLIYINPNYDFEKDKKTFFKIRQQKSTDDKDTINPLIKKSVLELNQSIQKDEFIQDLTTEINSQEGFEQIFEEVEFKIKSDIDIANFYRSLDIIPTIKDTNESINIGDGKSKTLSMLLQKKSYNNDKQKILIVEEPENHLFPLLQKYFIDLTLKFNLDQMIYTSHSPYIIDYRKMGQIIKFVIKNEDGKKNVSCNTLNIDENDYQAFGYMLNEEISQMFFYDKVLLVEGASEKYFYNVLAIKDKVFNEYLVKNKMGIFCVYGIDFGPAKRILTKLGIDVYIKTDNDIFPKQHRYAGLCRVFDCLDDFGKEELKNILGKHSISKEDFKFPENQLIDENIEREMEKITKLFKNYKVYLSNHHDGFEKDFLEFVGRKSTMQEDIEYLKKAKLKNLHMFITENKIDITIKQKNIHSILVDFINE